MHWVTSQVVMQPAFSDSTLCSSHTHLLSAVQPHLDILIFSFRNAQQGVDVGLVKENNPKTLQDFPV